jgi:cellulose synthase/poly-beta-1,6-N-acetylglucosamine synthase-like glycosyltransferase
MYRGTAPNKAGKGNYRVNTDGNPFFFRNNSAALAFFKTKGSLLWSLTFLLTTVLRFLLLFFAFFNDITDMTPFYIIVFIVCQFTELFISGVVFGERVLN